MRLRAKRVTAMRTVSKMRCFTFLLGCIGCCLAARAQDVVVIVNKGVQISEIKDVNLRAIFTGEKTRFSDGSHAVPVTLQGGPVHEVFLKNHLGESPDEFRALWRKAIFTGQGAMPKTFASESALIEYVAATPGAIGYVSHISPHDDVKLIPVQK
jgi:ABC-type phosphate transport system substrate-binding protein